MGSTALSDKDSYTKHLEKQLLTLHWLILSIGIIALIILTLGNQLFENIIFLPILGLIGYIFIKRIFIIPSITTFFLIVTHLLMDLISPSPDTFLNYLFYLFILFSLTLLGSLCGYFLLKSIHTFEKTSGVKKGCICMGWLVLVLALLLMLANFIHTNGNPISSYYAQCCMQKYLKTAYPDCTVDLSQARYDHKTHSYNANASLYTKSDELQTFCISYIKGQIKDDYFVNYLEDQPNECRLNKQAADAITKLLTSYNIPFSTVTCQLKLEKGIYDNIDFNKTDFNVPLPLTITLLTKGKQTYKTFGSWCNSIRSLLLSQGYQLDSIHFISSPHWEENSLSLTLDTEELTLPIENVETYDHFKDVGLDNALDASAPNPTPYNNYYPNSTLENILQARLSQLSSAPLYIEASSTSLGDLILDCCWTGNRISIDQFAENVMMQYQTLTDENLLNGYHFQSISFKYVWGTESESYEYTIYPENADTQSEKTIVDALLNSVAAH